MSQKTLLSIGLCSLLFAIVPHQNATGQVSETKPDAEVQIEEQTETDTTKKQAQMGVGVVPLHPAVASQLSAVVGKGRGVLVANVVKDSPADKEGLKIHDVIVTYDKQDVYSTEQLVKLVRNDKPGRSVAIGFVRGGQLSDAALTLGETEVRPSRRQQVLRMPLDDRFRMPARPSLERFREMVPNMENWNHFESLNISKDEDGTYKAKISYKDKDRKLDKTYEGSREDIEAAIKSDEELPEAARDHLLRGLDMKVRIREFFDRESFFPNREMFFRNGNRETFDWPDLDF